MPHPSHFTNGKETRCPLYRQLGRPQGQSGQLRKISPPLGFHPQTIQPIVNHRDLKSWLFELCVDLHQDLLQSVTLQPAISERLIYCAIFYGHVQAGNIKYEGFVKWVTSDGIIYPLQLFSRVKCISCSKTCLIYSVNP
jgi:hypothetical protein